MDQRPYESQATYASARCYVLKLHRDAIPARNSVRGRLEHIPSGAHVEFGCWAEMLGWIVRHSTDTMPQE